MIHGYDKLYIEKAMINMGDMIEYAVLDCDFNGDIFFKLFLESGLAQQFEIGNPSIIVGRSGPELAMEVMTLTNSQLHQTFLPLKPTATDDKPFPSPKWRSYRTEYYWCGWVLAYYQWYSRKSFLEIWNSISIATLEKLYPTLHEADISKSVETFNSLMAKPEKSTVSFLRQVKGFTQKELAEAAGMTISQLQRLEYGQRKVENLTLKTALSLADALGVDVSQLE